MHSEACGRGKTELIAHEEEKIKISIWLGTFNSAKKASAVYNAAYFRYHTILAYNEDSEPDSPIEAQQHP